MSKKKFISGKKVQEFFSSVNTLEQIDIEFLQESNAIEREYSFGALEDAKEAWEYLLTKEELTIPLIKGVHKLLMRNRDTLEKTDIGQFRNITVYVSGKPALNALKIEEALNQWLVNVKDLIENGKKESEIFKEKTVREQHVEYERIHPFVDGNGRTGRMFMNWTRLKLGLPILVIHRGEEQQEYYKWFQK